LDAGGYFTNVVVGEAKLVKPHASAGENQSIPESDASPPGKLR
jgi:hypothetical protein